MQEARTNLRECLESSYDDPEIHCESKTADVLGEGPRGPRGICVEIWPFQAGSQVRCCLEDVFKLSQG